MRKKPYLFTDSFNISIIFMINNSDNERIAESVRFTHIAKNPKFGRVPEAARKVKVDKRFQSMFKNKKFTVYIYHKRGKKKLLQRILGNLIIRPAAEK